MAIHELTDEQIRTLTVDQKDRWWLSEVYRGNMPQLTIRSALTGMILGGVLSLTNLYIGAKTGWTMGVGVTSVILAFAIYKISSRLRISSEFTVLENNAMQSIATAAGYMTSPMISSMAAYMMVTGVVVPFWQMMFWMSGLAILGVLFAFPFKRRFINDLQQPFPEGRAAGVVLDSLHHGEGAAAVLKAKLLFGFGALAALVKLWQSEKIIEWFNRQVGTNLFYIREFVDEWIYKPIGNANVPTIRGIPITDLTIRLPIDLTMMGAGGLMGIRTGVSLLIGATISYAILAPTAIVEWHEIPGTAITFRAITFWTLWAGVGMMTVASIISFFAKPKVLIDAFTNFFRKRSPGAAVSSETQKRMKQIELPLWVSMLGIPILGGLVVFMAWSFFGVSIVHGILAVVMVFFFCLIAINATGLTSITPIGAMGKLTQLTFGVLAPGNVRTNLLSASITGEVASNAANLLQDIKPGYMLGAKPRQQAFGHVLGVIAGALLSVPVFYLLFLQLPWDEAFALHPTAAYKINTKEFAMPAAIVWKGVADVLTQGIDKIPKHAAWATLFAIIAGTVLELSRILTRNRFPLSPIGIGLGFVIHFHTCFAMFLGAFIFWLVEKLSSNPESRANRVIVQNQEPICAGLIAGGALMGIVVMLVETVME